VATARANAIAKSLNDTTKRLTIEMRNNKFTGYVLGAIAAITYGMNPLFAVPLYREGMNSDSVLLFRYAIAIPIIIAMMKLRNVSLKIERRDMTPLAALGLIMAVSSIGLFMSYNYMNSGIASTLLFIYPLLVALIMAAMFHERVSKATAICIAVVLVGIGLLYKAEDGATLSLTGTLLVGLSALSYAIYIVVINLPRMKHIPSLTLTLYVLFVGVIVFLIRVAFFEGLTLPQQWYHWLNLVGLAIFPTTISFVCAARAIQIIGPTPTAILGALEPVSAIFFGVTILGQWLTGREIIGLILIISAVTVVVAGQRVSDIASSIGRAFKKKHSSK
jgi:drug/metabolite transporter (DMT)-like permease